MEEDSRSSDGKENTNPIIVFFTNLLAAIKLPFPPKKNAGDKDEPAVAVEPVVVKSSVVLEDEGDKPALVTFPRQNFVSLKLGADAEEGERNTNPVLLWQVYAIGGFFVLRWAWKRWNEDKGRKKSGDEPPPPPPHD